MTVSATIADTAVNPAVFVPAQSIGVAGTNVPSHVMDRNISINMAADYPRLHLHPGWGKFKGRKLAIVGGGPSLNEFLPMIGQFEDVMVCGSAHDHVVGHGINPTYSIQCDGSKKALEFMKLRAPGTQYLIASCCDPEMFEGLSDVWMWHCLGSGTYSHTEPSIAGGCMIMLRALPVAILLGYQDLHFFGMDSCFSDVESQHAYEINESKSNVLTVRVGDGREFLTSPALLAQAQQFQEMCHLYGFMFNPHVYGDGLIAEIINVGTGAMNE